MATIKEVAQRAGVSVGTVSNVLTGSVPVSPKLAQRVSRAIEELNYRPSHLARSLKNRRTKMLGIIIPDISNPLFTQMARGAEDAALKNGYLLVSFNTDDQIERQEQVLAVLQSRQADGVLLVSARTTGDVAPIQKAAAGGMPVVCVDRVPRGLEVDNVTVDNEDGARRGVEHLIALGHREIAIITGALRLQTARQRLNGYKAALRAAGLKASAALIKEGDFRTSSGYELGKELLSARSRPSALFVSSGMMALGVLHAMDELGLRCPEDVALVTFDDLGVAHPFQPQVTAVAQPAYLMGFRGVELLLDRLEGRVTSPAPQKVQLPTELIIRRSSDPGAARAAALA